MKIDDKKLKQILIDGGYAEEGDIKKAESAAKARRTSFADFLFSGEFIDRDLLGQAIAESHKVSYADLNSNQPSREQVLKISEDAAKKLRVVLFAHDEKTGKTTITTDSPKQGLQEELKKIFPAQDITIAYSLPEDIDVSFVYYQKALDTRFAKIIESNKRIAPELLEEIFEDAFTFHASDIHFEPQGKEVVVRFRIDGVLAEAGRIPKEHYENILNRIKVQSNLRIDEHFAAQDGSMRYEGGGKMFDMRTSIAPTVEGEKVVLRVLATYVKGFGLSDIGLSEGNQKLLEEASKKPFGMILVTGPTGSGKTTTLYAVLKLLNRPEVNITTIEDPVEYKMSAVNQIQVNPQTNLTFAKGLRSIVRQDPDIILVGEVRDDETAEIAVNAALTGHLLLSTFHANDAATAIPRLLDMGSEPFLLASTLEMIIAQRLVRKICENCRFSTEEPLEKLKEQFKEADDYFSGEKTTLYRGKGCNACGNTGYKGRTAIFEFISITPEMENLVLENPSTQEVWELARKQGSASLFEDGILKVKSGVTTIEELMRVSAPPSYATKSKTKKKK